MSADETQVVSTCGCCQPGDSPTPAEIRNRAGLSRIHYRVGTYASFLLAMTEQEPDFASVLEWARALREQIDWEAVRSRTEASPFAKAFFTLVEALGIVENVPA